MESNFKLYKRTYRTKTDSKVLKPNLWLPKGKCGREDKLGGWEGHTQTTTYVIDKKDLLHETG